MGALQGALLALPGFVSGLGALLPNGGRPVNDAIFLTGRLGGPIAPHEPEPQFCYVAQVTEQVSNEQAIIAWRRMLVDRPEAVMPANRDLVEETEGRLVAEGITPSVRAGVIRGLSSIEQNLWTRFYFDAVRPRSSPAADAAAARAVLARFRGDPSRTPGAWFDNIEEPWRSTVLAMAASRNDTAGLLNRGPLRLRNQDDVLAALARLEGRLVAPLTAYFEGNPVPFSTPAASDTTPPSPPPSAEQVVGSFLYNQIPPDSSIDRVAITQRDVYDDLRQARIINSNAGAPVPPDGPTRTERARARQHLRTIFANCAGFRSPLTLPQPPPPVAPPAILPGQPVIPNPFLPINLLDTTNADRRLDTILRELTDAIKQSRVTIPSAVDIGQTAFDNENAARQAARMRVAAFRTPAVTTRPCAAFSALVNPDNADGLEPLHIQEADILRLKALIDGTAVRPPRSTDIDDGGFRDAARKLRFVSPEQLPVVSVDPDDSALVIRSNFMFRLVGILEDLPIPGDDVIANAEITVRVEFLRPVGAVDQTPENARANPGPSRSLRIGITPFVGIPASRQPSFAAISYIFLLIVAALSAIVAGIAFLLGAYIGAMIAGGAVLAGGAIGFGVLLHELETLNPSIGDGYAPNFAMAEHLSGCVGAPG